ncbi:MAG: ABC transporter ATP-binding protein [Myxococcales bacterium]|nr:ABC transporter ATP-binding protein [Myxococcales bacterium]
MITLNHITKVYQTKRGPHVVLHDVSFEVPLGVSMGILGRNGAGKSTLLRIIGGAEMPTAGSISRLSRVSWPIGFSGAFHGSLTGEENCRFAARIYAQDIDRVVDETRSFADIGDYFYEPVRTYSTGMRARLAFGLSMSIDFDVYLVDEVTAVGDRRFRRKCNHALQARRSHASLIVVSHNMPTLRTLCDRCAVLDRGQLTVYDTVDEAETIYMAEPTA